MRSVAASRRLVDGVYEDLVTAGLAAAIDEAATSRHVDVAPVDAVDVPAVVGRYIGREVERALAGVGGHGDERLGRQLDLAERILALLVAGEHTLPEQLVSAPARRLRAVFADRALELPRPVTPLSVSTLLTLGPREPRIGHEIAREIDTANRVDALVSFVTMSGVRLLRDALERLALRRGADGIPALRLITTTYTGATEAAAVEALARLPGVEIKVSYDGRRTRLHAKAWLFHRDPGPSTAYVGSANLSSSALTGGLEWTVKASAADLPHVVAKFSGAFETLWADREFERFDPARQDDQERLRGALGAARGRDQTTQLQFFALAPYPFQEEILDRLRAEREVHGRHRNLVVAATGTGKTMVAAFDYARRAVGSRPRLLFVAHRRELLLQARDTFRHVLRDGSFGTLLTGEDEPERLDHLFATVQTLRTRQFVERLGATFWDHVVVDECHHVPAESYQDVVPRLRPAVLLGLTATPERADGRSLLADFDHHVAAELRLWHALDDQLLVPFEYHGLDDGVDERRLATLRWNRRTGYAVDDLDGLYTGNHARADLALGHLHDRVADLRAVHALGFCVSVAHAEFMASHFTRKGMPALALHGGSSPEQRRDAPRRLAAGEVNVIFTCDLYNEGVDLPFVDTLLLLRPTESATLFLQQLGRGLRLHPGKASCLVLDFIGRHRSEFRFDAALGSLTGLPRGRLPQATEAGFPFLPSGCSLSLDAVARDTVLRSLRASVEARWSALVAEAARIRTDGAPDLQQFLAETGRELDDVYRHGSWTQLVRDAGRSPARVSDDELATCRRFRHLLHVDDRDRLDCVDALLDGRAVEGGERPSLMLAYQLNHESRRTMAAEDVSTWLRGQPHAADELRQLSRILADRVASPTSTRPVAEWPLVLHRHYARREILTACGYWTATRKVPQQQGVLRLAAERRELLFVTLDKSERDFSPTTRYRDYAISRDRFHWETQGAVAADSATARRYAGHAAAGWSIHLFVQARKGEAFAYLGPVDHERQEGSRPVSIIWRLHVPMPAALYQAYATLASG